MPLHHRAGGIFCAAQLFKTGHLFRRNLMGNAAIFERRWHNLHIEMKPRNVMLSLVLVCVLLVWAMLQSRHYRAKEALDRKPANLQFTALALCQLRCLGLQKADAEKVLAEGLVLYHRSNRRARPCPLWVIQGSSKGGVTFRLRLEQCSNHMLVLQAGLPGKTVACTCNDAPPGAVKMEQLHKK